MYVISMPLRDLEVRSPCIRHIHLQLVPVDEIGSLSTRVFETRTATGRGHFACQGSGVSHISLLIISNEQKILSNVNVVV